MTLDHARGQLLDRLDRVYARLRAVAGQPDFLNLDCRECQGLRSEMEDGLNAIIQVNEVARALARAET